jgi:hypothetical protein
MPFFLDVMQRMGRTPEHAPTTLDSVAESYLTGLEAHQWEPVGISIRILQFSPPSILAHSTPEETCPLCQANPPMLKYQIGSGRIRDEGYACLSCACRLLNDITTLEIGHWLTRR